MNLYAAAILIPVGVIMYTAHGGLKATFMSTYLHTIVVFIALCLFAFEIYATPASGLGSPATVWEHLTDIAVRGGAYKGVSLASPMPAAACGALPGPLAAAAVLRRHAPGPLPARPLLAHPTSPPYHRCRIPPFPPPPLLAACRLWTTTRRAPTSPCSPRVASSSVSSTSCE
jgi:hypothetical protein